MIKTFTDIQKKIEQENEMKMRLVLVNAHEETALNSVVDLFKQGIIEPILVGDSVKIESLLNDKHMGNDFQIIHADSDQMSAFKSVELIRNNKADILMKGFIQTSDLLREVVNKETGIKAQSVLSHVALLEIPYLKRLFIVSDGGMIPYPSLEQKVGIIKNAIKVSHALGWTHPKVALLDAAEHENPRIPVSTESIELSKLNWKSASVEGPISIDIALSSDAASKKGYKGVVQGDANVLIVPDIISGNILGKVGTLLTNGLMAGVIEGASVPIVLTSRGSSKEEKENSILLACMIQKGGVERGTDL